MSNGVCQLFKEKEKEKQVERERTGLTAPASLSTHGSMVGMFMRIIVHPQQNGVERFDNLD